MFGFPIDGFAFEIECPMFGFGIECPVFGLE
jgi:hypothetical protein